MFLIKLFAQQLTGEATYEPIVFLKQPYLLRGNVKFGPNKDDKSTTADGKVSSVDFELNADILPESGRLYDQLGGSKANSATRCPAEILKFSPPPQNRYCDQSIYRALTTVHEYGMNVTFANVSSGRSFR